MYPERPLDEEFFFLCPEVARRPYPVFGRGAFPLVRQGVRLARVSREPLDWSFIRFSSRFGPVQVVFSDDRVARAAKRHCFSLD